MAVFAGFATTLPDPVNTIGSAGQEGGTPGPGFKSVKVRSVDMLMNTTTNSGRRNTRAATYHKWMIDITYNPMTEAEFSPVYSFLLMKKHTLRPFFVNIPELNTEYPIFPTVVANQSRGDEKILIDTTAFGISPPQYFTIGAFSKVYMMTRSETNTNAAIYSPTIGVDQELLHITPSLANDITSGLTLDFQSESFYVQQVGDVSYTIDAKNLYTFSLKLEEIPAND